MRIDYVISAPAQGLLPSHRLNRLEYKDEFIKPVQEISTIVKNKIREDCDSYDPLVSLLFNAYTEVCYISSYQHFGNFLLDSVYSDSGGLQIVTAGRTNTPEIKQEIYRQQAYADYAMIFDEIPLDVKKETDHNGKVIRSRNERSNYNNKSFIRSNHCDAAILTGKNVKEQIEAFKKLNTKTKVILIVQGNTTDDFQLYHDKICEQLEDDDYDHIGGLALADTCIGNGEFESIGMLRAAAAISKNCHDNIRSHLHILGVGSIKRLKPIIYLKRSGYLEHFDHISYDSSSHTSCFTYGLLKLNGTCVALGKGREKRGENYFSRVYNFFEPVLRTFVQRDKFLDITFGDGGPSQWSYANIKRRARASGDKNHYFAAHLSKMCYTYYMIHNFCVNVNKMFEETNNPLLTVKDENDINEWIQDTSKTRKKKSKAIKIKEELTNLEGFFS